MKSLWICDLTWLAWPSSSFGRVAAVVGLALVVPLESLCSLSSAFSSADWNKHRTVEPETQGNSLACKWLDSRHSPQCDVHKHTVIESSVIEYVHSFIHSLGKWKPAHAATREQYSSVMQWCIAVKMFDHSRLTPKSWNEQGENDVNSSSLCQGTSGMANYTHALHTRDPVQPKVWQLINCSRTNVCMNICFNCFENTISRQLFHFLPV